MSQTAITLAFEQWKAQQATTGEPVLLDEFIFALVPGLDPSLPVDRSETLPPAAQIVHRESVTRKGVVNENAVVHSAVLGADVGDFSFNWIGLTNKATGTLAMIVHAPEQKKLKTKEGQQGNVLTRSFLMEYTGAQSETAINTPAETWQIDFTARMAGIDERQRLENIDLYGAAAFLGDGWLVGKTGNQYFVTKGAGYVAGLRAVAVANQNITVTTKPVKVWLDVCWTGALTSVWAVQGKVTVAASLADYEQNGVKHYVFALASIDANGNITDLRPKGGLSDQSLKEHEKSRNHPDGTLNAKGFVQLSSATDSESELLAATSKAVKAANDNANSRIKTSDITSSNSDGVPGRILKVGDYGLSAALRVPAGADLATFFATARGLVYRCDTTTYINGPSYSGSTWFDVFVSTHETENYRTLLAISAYGDIETATLSGSGKFSNGWVSVYSTRKKPSASDVGALAADGTAKAATKLANTRKIGGVSFDGTTDIDLPGVNKSGNQSTSGNAGSATKLQTARKINGVSFDGTSDITLTSASLGTSGWFKDAGSGFIQQYGSGTLANASPSIVVQFPIAFPSACLNVTASDNGTSPKSYGASGLTTTGARIATSSTAGVSGFYYKAYGKGGGATKSMIKTLKAPMLKALKAPGLESEYYYSAVNNAFYPSALYDDYAAFGSWPADATAVSRAIYDEFGANSAPEGKARAAGEDGFPCWVDVVPPTHEELVAMAESKKAALMTEAEDVIKPLERVVKLDMATDEEKARLVGWERYSVLLNRVDTSTAPDIGWPEVPEDVA